MNMDKNKNKPVLTSFGRLRKLPEGWGFHETDGILGAFAQEVRPELWVRKEVESRETLGGARIDGLRIESTAAESPCLDIDSFCRDQVRRCPTLHEASVRARQALLRNNSFHPDKLVFETRLFAGEVLWFGSGVRFPEGLYHFRSSELIDVWGDLRIPLWCSEGDNWTRLLEETLPKLAKAYAVWDEVRAENRLQAKETTGRVCLKKSCLNRLKLALFGTKSCLKTSHERTCKPNKETDNA